MSVEPPAPDRAAGMLCYSVPGERRSGKLRVRKEDFGVEEIFDLGQVEPERKEGYVPVYRLTKMGLDTPHAAERLGEALKSKVNFAGLKDGKAATSQYVSARSSRAEDPPSVKGQGFEAERVGYLPRPISRGMSSGNAFELLVRTDEDLSAVVESAYAMAAEMRLPNFFGYQRFGLKGMVNQRIGKALVMRDFRTAVELLVGEPRRGENPAAAEAREAARSGNLEHAVRSFTPKQDIERRAVAQLLAKPGDYLGAMRKVPILPRRLFVQSYQSYLFNLALSASLRAGMGISAAEPGDNWAELTPDGLRPTRVHGVRETISGPAIPLIQIVGFAFRDYGSRFDRQIVRILGEEGISPSQFYIKEAEELSAEGGFRHAPLLVRNASYERVTEGFLLRFSLGRGEYATTLVREILKPEDPLLEGL